jgi:hypothetical protein
LSFWIVDNSDMICLQEYLQLAEEQVVLITEVKIKRGATDRGSVQYILHRSYSAQ